MTHPDHMIERLLSTVEALPEGKVIHVPADWVESVRQQVKAIREELEHAPYTRYRRLRPM